VVNAVNAERQWRQFARFEEVFLGHFVVNVMNVVNAESEWRQLFAALCLLFCQRGERGERRKARVASPMVNAERQWRRYPIEHGHLVADRGGERGERRKAMETSQSVDTPTARSQVVNAVSAERQWRPEFFAQGPADELRHVVVNAVNAERQWRRGGGQEWFGEGDFGRERGERRKAMEDP